MAKHPSSYGHFAHEVLEWLLQCPALRQRTRIVVVGFGKPVAQDAPFPTTPERLKMIENKGQRVPLLDEEVKGKTADGQPAEFDSDAGVRWESSAPEFVEVREVDGHSYAYLNAQGAALISATVDADRTSRTRELTVVGTIICNDPATEATIAEFGGGDDSGFGPAEPIPTDPPAEVA